MARPRPPIQATAILLATWCLVFLRSSSAPAVPALRPPPPPSAPGGTLCIPHERDALLAFKAGLTDPTNYLSSWRAEEDCCRWMGVGCSNRTGHIIKLQVNSYGAIGGEIPHEIGMLTALTNLNLSWNHLSSTIPLTIRELRAVESLDFSHNELSGEIPASLCGPPVSRNCSGTEITPWIPEDQHGGMSDELSLYLGIGTGFVAGLWIIFCGFLFKRSWRVLWFSFFDHMCDWVYVRVAVSWASFARKE